MFLSALMAILMTLTNFLGGAPSPAATATPVLAAEEDFSYEIKNGEATIDIYWGDALHPIVPETLDGVPVTTITNLSFTSVDIESITLPKSVTTIEPGAFSLCDTLLNIYVDAENTSYKSLDGLLLDAADTLLFLPPLRQSTPLPDGIRGLGARTFSSSYIEAVTLPNNLTRIESEAFSLCFNLKSIHIPKTVTEIGENPFHACLALESITVDSENPVFEIQDGALVNKETHTLLVYPSQRSAAEYTVRADITRIGDNAFDGAAHLAHINLPEGLDSIGADAFSACESMAEITLPASVSDIASTAFTCCLELKRINVHEDNPSFAQIGGVLFSKDKRTLLAYPNKKVAIYTVPDGTTAIGNDAFAYCYNLMKVKLPEGVVSIGDSAFYHCGLCVINFPASLKEIGEYAFMYSDINSVLLPEGFADLGPYAFYYCPDLKSVSLPASLKNVSVYAFGSALLLTHLDIKEGTTEIGEHAFSGCEKLKSLSLPEGLLSLGASAFSFCTSLTEISLPSSLQIIDAYAFSFSESIDNLFLPPQITYINDTAFAGLPQTTAFSVEKGSYAEQWATANGYGINLSN